MRLADLAARIEGTVEGDGSVDVVRGQSLEDAGPGSLTYLGDPKYASKARATKAGGILL